MEAADPKYCTGRIMAIKKGSKSFQKQRKMFCRKFGWPSMKVLQIKVHRLKQQQQHHKLYLHDYNYVVTVLQKL